MRSGSPEPSASHGPILKYRFFVLVFSMLVCGATWFLLEHTRLGALVRAGTERPELLRCFGVRVPLLVSGTFAFAAGLAALAGVLAAPLHNISPFMGQEMIATTFAVVVAGGLGSIAGSVVMGFAVGVLSAVAAIWYPPAANAATYILMIVVLIVRPGGIFRGIDVTDFPLHYTPISLAGAPALHGQSDAEGRGACYRADIAVVRLSGARVRYQSCGVCARWASISFLRLLACCRSGKPHIGGEAHTSPGS